MAKAFAVIAQGVRRNFFLNMWSRDEDILLTQSEQAFETMTILSKAEAFAVIAQGVRRNFFLNMWSRDEEILLTQSEQAFETMTILSKAKAFAVIAQKWPEASSL